MVHCVREHKKNAVMLPEVSNKAIKYERLKYTGGRARPLDVPLNYHKPHDTNPYVFVVHFYNSQSKVFGISFRPKNLRFHVFSNNKFER